MGAPGEPYDPNQGYQPPPGYPPASQYPPQYPQQYPQYPPYAQYPQYGPQPYPAGYPYGYGYPPPGAMRPGSATAAAVLGYVTAGLLIAAGLLLFLGASIIDDFDFNNSQSVRTTEYVLDGILNLVAGGLLLAGGVSFSGRNANGRILLSVGCGIVIGESVYWLVRGDATDGSLFWALVFAALVIISVSLAWTSAVSAWLRPVPTP